MTGFGQATLELEGVRLKAEIKSLNSKFLDLSLKLPKEIADKETELRNLVQRVLQRGKINLLLELEYTSGGASKAVAVDEALFKAYFDKYQQLASEMNAASTDLFRLALHSPGVLDQQETAEAPAWEAIEKVVTEACSACLEFRSKEGQSLAGKLTDYIEGIDTRLTKVQQLDGQRIANIRTRIGKNLDDIRERVQVDENRFEQELIYYIEKLDITEEKVRLKRHLDYFREVMGMEESQGKKLGFISQELGREINTLGSKANDADIQQLVVEMKDELEKIKEQLLNIL